MSTGFNYLSWFYLQTAKQINRFVLVSQYSLSLFQRYSAVHFTLYLYRFSLRPHGITISLPCRDCLSDMNLLPTETWKYANHLTKVEIRLDPSDINIIFFLKQKKTLSVKQFIFKIILIIFRQLINKKFEICKT